MKYLKRHRDEILIFSFFVLLSVVATDPLIFKMGSHLYGLGGDALSAVSRLWRIKYVHLNPSTHPLIAYPYGINLIQHVNYLVWNSLLNPLTSLFNEIFTFNFVILISFFLSAIIVYYLVYYFTGDKLASMFSGVIYTLCPYHFAHSAFHLPSLQWIPLYALALFKLDDERSYRSALFCALSFSLVFLTYYYYGYFMTVFTVVFVVWRGWFGLRRKSKVPRKVATLPRGRQSPKSPSSEAELLRRTGKVNRKDSLFHTCKVVLVAIVVAAAIILSLTYHFLPNIFVTPERYMRPFRDLTSNSARPLGYLLPSQDNPFFGGFTKRLIKNPFYGGHPTEHTLYLGWVGIVLSIFAIRAWRRKNKLQAASHKLQATKVSPKSRFAPTGQASNRVNWQTGKLANWSTRTQKGVSFFLFAGIVALLFSHSPYAEIGNFRILFPSYFMYKIVPMFRTYARFGIVVMLCVSVLAGIGLASILKKIKSVKKRRFFLTVILLLIFIEFAPTLPAPMVNAVNPPSAYEWLSKQEGDFIIVEYPLETDYEYLFWQRIHQKRLVNGAQPETYADEVRKEIVDILKPETPGVLKYLGVKYVILHPDKYLESEDVPVIGEVPDVSKQEGLRLIRIFEEAQVYKIVAEPIEPTIKD